jgi:hypothetical protein
VRDRIGGKHHAVGRDRPLIVKEIGRADVDGAAAALVAIIVRGVVDPVRVYVRQSADRDGPAKRIDLRGASLAGIKLRAHIQVAADEDR